MLSCHITVFMILCNISGIAMCVWHCAVILTLHYLSIFALSFWQSSVFLAQWHHSLAIMYFASFWHYTVFLKLCNLSGTAMCFWYYAVTPTLHNMSDSDSNVFLTHLIENFLCCSVFYYVFLTLHCVFETIQPFSYCHVFLVLHCYSNSALCVW